VGADDEDVDDVDADEPDAGDVMSPTPGVLPRASVAPVALTPPSTVVPLVPTAVDVVPETPSAVRSPRLDVVMPVRGTAAPVVPVWVPYPPAAEFTLLDARWLDTDEPELVTSFNM
jgi:hypothetical protein